MLKTFLLPSLLISAVMFNVPAALAHSWYPWECCHDFDCAPVDKVQSAPELDGVIVTSKVGTALVPASFPKRASKDSRMHICLRKEAGGETKVLCVFLPPDS